MRIYYNDNYNINLGILNLLHPFDGRKFAHVFKKIVELGSIDIKSPISPIKQDEVDRFADSLLKLLLKKKRYILRALEVPYLPLIPYAFIDKYILLPMRWGVAGTLDATKDALQGNICWNLSGGYHHASRASSEGFCIYNDIGIAVDILNREGLLKPDAKILIVDVDAHHGNGNAQVFMENKNVTILDIYNNAIYPRGGYTKERVNINIPLEPGTHGELYLTKLNDGLCKLSGEFDLAYVVAGTDVLAVDPLGGVKLTMRDCVARDSVILDKLIALSTPTIFLGGGGYSKQSAAAIAQSIGVLYERRF